MREELEQIIEKAVKDDYLSESLNYYKNNRTIDNYIDILKILNYRKFYLGIVVNFKNKKMLKQFKKTGFIPLESENEYMEKEPLVAELSNGVYSENTICVFSDPTKIDFSNCPANGIEETTLKDLYEKYIKDKNIGGIIFNSFEEKFILPLPYIEYVINGNYDEIINRLQKN